MKSRKRGGANNTQIKAACLLLAYGFDKVKFINRKTTETVIINNTGTIDKTSIMNIGDCDIYAGKNGEFYKINFKNNTAIKIVDEILKNANGIIQAMPLLELQLDGAELRAVNGINGAAVLRRLNDTTISFRAFEIVFTIAFKILMFCLLCMSKLIFPIQRPRPRPVNEIERGIDAPTASIEQFIANPIADNPIVDCLDNIISQIIENTTRENEARETELMTQEAIRSRIVMAQEASTKIVLSELKIFLQRSLSDTSLSSSGSNSPYSPLVRLDSSPRYNNDFPPPPPPRFSYYGHPTGGRSRRKRKYKRMTR